MKLKKFRFIQFLEYAAAMAVAYPFYILPRPLAFRAGEIVGELMFRAMKRRRAIGYKNLDIAFGDTLSMREKDRILRANFRNLGKSLAEVIHFPKMRTAYLQEKVHIVGQEHYLAARSKGKGVIYLTAHFGNWEMSSHAQSALGYPMSIIVRPLDNRYLDRVVARLRTIHGNTLLPRRNGLKQMIAALKRNETIGILMDQNTLRSKGIFVDFLGKPACTTPVIALLALRYEVPVIPAFIVRTGFDTHTVYLGSEVAIQQTDDTQNDIALNTARFNTIIEDFIRRYPDQWFWVHNRWKNQPIPDA
jgi:KDO2-lipid IV(A) lauroyltransferase